ncbi:voltage-gated chloride channel family protein [Serpentinicella alkaliphila]|uniref:H+/Cl-antiporter ClcA n=1 Tax=Serpentinicella alkaliphila TaxID=1734049 RepID=A0A4R2U693_9FIRM|nr:voltage-gated chloride channel family protein [Serpentinicella alkaliphila]QUH26468.1 voltage-gated chloride channel family protein [Serpentinicella alkaliphila]TCQ03253.1 H+/Cl- antiporter ClcA [Serpentinicella alkaliphila]
MNQPENRPYYTPFLEKYIGFLSTLLKWVFLGALIGVIVGSTSALLLNTNDFLTDVREANAFLILFLPVGGGIIGYIYKYYGMGSRRGNDLVLEHIHHGQGSIPIRMGPIVFICTFISHLLGGSTGREGAAIQMGASISEGVNRLFKINKIDRRILIISGISGGFGSAFGAPLAGTVFGMEVVALGKMKYEAIVPCFVASLVGHLVSTAWGVKHDHFLFENIPAITSTTLIQVALVSIIFSLASVLYSQIRHEIKRLSDKYLNQDLVLRGVVGGIILVALVYITGTRDYLGRGLPMVEEAFKSDVPTFAFLAKIIFTAITMGFGFRGGEVIPLFFIGATLGNTLSNFINLPASFLAGVGLIAVFCGAANTPISCFLFSLEMFNGKGKTYFFIACLVSYIFSGNHGIYGAQKIYSPKSRLFNIPDGETITNVENKKENPDSH